jgi:hypothetical protein
MHDVTKGIFRLSLVASEFYFEVLLVVLEGTDDDIHREAPVLYLYPPT